MNKGEGEGVRWRFVVSGYQGGRSREWTRLRVGVGTEFDLLSLSKCKIFIYIYIGEIRVSKVFGGIEEFLSEGRI